jgi:hypothetical protein
MTVSFEPQVVGQTGPAKRERDILAQYDPLSEFNILSYVTWNEGTLHCLSQEWAIRPADGVTLPEFVHILPRVFPKADNRKPKPPRNWVQKLISFYRQIDY